MTETLWAVIIGGAIGGIISLLSTWLASTIEHRKWVREKKLEDLHQRKNDLKLLFGNALSMIDSYQEKIATGQLFSRPKLADFAVLNVANTKLNLLLMEALQALVEEKVEWEELNKEWGSIMYKEIAKIDSEIEKLLK